MHVIQDKAGWCGAFPAASKQRRPWVSCVFLAVSCVRDFSSSLIKNTKTTGTEKGIYAMCQCFILSLHSKVRLDKNNIEKSI